jgi:hypothetical protein
MVGMSRLRLGMTSSVEQGWELLNRPAIGNKTHLLFPCELLWI